MNFQMYSSSIIDFILYIDFIIFSIEFNTIFFFHEDETVNKKFFHPKKKGKKENI